MKVYKGKMLLEDMGLVPGERFQVGTGKKAWVAEYVGVVEENGKVYDEFKPVKANG
jgi:hypothetical protein